VPAADPVSDRVRGRYVASIAESRSSAPKSPVSSAIASRVDYLSTTDDLPISIGTQSPAFLARYGKVTDLVEHLLPASGDSAMGEVVAAAIAASAVKRNSAKVRDRSAKVRDRSAKERSSTCEAYFNQYPVVVILAETRLVPLGERIVVAGAMLTQAEATPH
jgi:hypothetical protein